MYSPLVRVDVGAGWDEHSIVNVVFGRVMWDTTRRDWAPSKSLDSISACLL